MITFCIHEEKDALDISELSKQRTQHEFLCNTIRKISSAYQLVLFISTTFYIFEVTYSMYNTIQLIISPPSQWDTLQIFIVINANLIWAVFLVYNLSYLAWQCEKLATEVK
jgi:hypothetical protein